MDDYDIQQMRRDLESDIRDVKVLVTDATQALELVGIDIERLKKVREYQREVMDGFKSVIFWLMDVHRMSEPTHFTKDIPSQVKGSGYHRDKLCPVCSVIYLNTNLMKNARDYLHH